MKSAEVVDRPVSGPDYMATVLTLLGIDPTKDPHAGSRPVRTVASGGKAVPEVVGKR